MKKLTFSGGGWVAGLNAVPAAGRSGRVAVKAASGLAAVVVGGSGSAVRRTSSGLGVGAGGQPDSAWRRPSGGACWW
jgi:hypothetical protein